MSAPGGDEREPLRVGRRLEDRFVIEGLLGQGGMGVVLRARDLEAGRSVAIKVIRERDPSRVERFRREGRIMASLRHPGLLAVHSAGVCEVGPYLVCDLVAGARALDEAWAGAPQAQRVAWLRDAARALGVAHAQGIVHRDVKPQNLLVDDAGLLRVTDFGLAVEPDVTRLTQPGGLVGTIGYMAPEQVVAHPRGITPATDVWALGVVLHEALTGENLFVGGSPIEVLSNMCRVDVAAPGTCAPGVPAALDGICLRALARDPDRRYPDGEALARDLDAFLEGRSAAAGPPRRRPRRALVGVGASLAIAAVVAAVAAGRPRDPVELLGALSADALAALSSPRPLAEDLATIEALARRLEARRADAPTRDGALARARVTALVGLARLVRGDHEGAVAAEADLGAADDGGAHALRGALAAVTTGSDAERARILLGRAIAGGVARPELRLWRAQAVGRAGLVSSSDAGAVLSDLDAARDAGVAVPGDLRARALLRRGDLPAAWAAVTALSGAVAPLRWEIAVARARAAFDRDALAAAVEALAGERPPGACGADAEALRARALARADRAVVQLAAEQLEPPGVREALDLVRLAHLADPARPLPLPVVSGLLAYATSMRRGDVDHEPAFLVADLAPLDAEVQRAVALFADRLRDVHRGQFIPVVQRALASCGERDLALRDTLEVHLCRLLSLDPARHVECVTLAGALLSRLTDPLARGAVLFARAEGHRRAGRSREALPDVDAALALEQADSSAMILLRARLLLDLQRHAEALVEGQRFMEHAHVELGTALEYANAICWEAGRASGDLEGVRGSVVRLLAHHPAYGGWQVRLAWLERALDEPAAPATLRAAVPTLLEDASQAVRALADEVVSAADALERGDAGAAASLDALVERLERLRGGEPTP